MKKTILILGLILSISAILSQVPRTLSFTARLTDDEGLPITEPTEVIVRLYDSEMGGTEAWSETMTVDPDEDGNITVILGSSTPLDIDFDRPYFMGLEIMGETMPERVGLTGSPYSLSSINTINGQPPDESGNFVFADGEDVSWEWDPETGAIAPHFTGSAEVPNRQHLGDDEENGAVQVYSTTSAEPVVNIDATPGPSQGLRVKANNSDSAVVSVINESTSSAEPVIYVENSSTDIFSTGINIVSAGGSGMVIDHTPSVEEAISLYIGNNEASNWAIGIAADIISEGDSSTAIAGFHNSSYGLGYGIAGYTASNAVGAAGVFGVNYNSDAESPYGVVGKVSGGVTIDFFDGGAGILGIIDNGYGQGVRGVNTSEEAGYGVLGISENEYGVVGISKSEEDYISGIAGTVYAESFGKGVSGVYGSIDAATDSSAGVYAKEASSEGLVFGLLAETVSATEGAAGILGISRNEEATAPVGVMGYAKSATGGTGEIIPAGVKGIFEGSGEAFGVGVYGEATSGEDSEAAGVYGYTENGYGVVGETDAEEFGFAGVYGSALAGKASGVIGETYSSTDSTAGVYGASMSGTGLSYGVVGEVVSNEYYSSGVLGLTEMTIGVSGIVRGEESEGIGVYGEVKQGNATAIVANNESPEDGAIALHAKATGEGEGLKYGVLAETYSPEGVAVYGEASAETGENVGVAGISMSSDGYGVYGSTGASEGGIGVYAECISEDGIALHAGSEGTGIYTYGQNAIIADADSVGIVVAVAGAANDALRATGNITIQSEVATTAKFNPVDASFEINDPTGVPLTVFGGPSNRVAIQTVNGSATPTIPDNNFTVSVEAPLVLSNGEHGLTITCPECCIEPCGGGGMPCATCEGDVLIVGEGDGTPGGLRVNDSSGAYLFWQDLMGTSSSTGGSFDGDLHVGGDIYASSKHFVAPHPEREGYDIVFTSVESDQVYIEHRSVINLNEGYGEYELPHEFQLMASEGSYTVLCTPQSIDAPANIGAEVTQDGVVRIRDFKNGNIPVAFNVKAIRSGYEDHQVVREHKDDPLRD